MRLVAERLQRVWGDGDAVLPVDTRLPEAALATLLDGMAPDELVESTLHVDPGSLGLPPEGPYLARDELTGEEWTWEGPTAYVKLGPDERVAHVLSLVRHHGP